MENETLVIMDLKRELQKKVEAWVERTFNYIQVEVVQKFSDNSMSDYIRNKSKEDAFEEWLDDMNEETVWDNFFDSNDINIEQSEINEDVKATHYEDFVKWCLSEYEDDIEEFISDQENYPMWNTLFEFRDSWFNYEEQIQKCLSVGLGVIEGLEPFNAMVFMTSCGHSFYSAYWIPLYLEIYESEKERFKDVNYSDL